MNILVVTMGTTWQVIPELAGFLNPNLGIYDNHHSKGEIEELRAKYSLEPVDQIWVITTSGSRTDDSINSLKKWQKYSKHSDIEIKYFRVDPVEELATVNECELMADYIYRVVLDAKENAEKLYLSLAGGRKTMSAEMQRAGSVFGCDAMLHVVDKNMDRDEREEFGELDFCSPMPKHLADYIMPLVTFGKTIEDAILSIEVEISAEDYPIECKSNNKQLYHEINNRISQAKNLYLNYTKKIVEGKISSNFHSLYSRSNSVITRLENMRDFDYDTIKRIPKAQLHCHFGGIASPKAMIEIALENKDDVERLCQEHDDYCSWLKGIRNLIEKEDLRLLKKDVPNVKDLRSKFNLIAEPFTVAGFLIQFEGNSQLLRDFIYGKKIFKAIGIKKYESLGDLQGSGILQNEKSIRKACQILIDMCADHNVKYIEVRCSPVNYTRGGLTEGKVVEVMMDEFDKAVHTQFKLIFIASRHGTMSNIYRHIELATDLLKDSMFSRYFAGFDLAGNEESKDPAQLRGAFMPLMEKCIHLTIHAGETGKSDNIWQAIYHLNADRIGHGLKLLDEDDNGYGDLVQRIKDYKITIEMCPSSNDQIIGYDGKYPMKKYLDNRIKVTINTDNPGISETDFSNEYLVANRLCGGELSMWDVFAMVRNSFRGAFIDMDKKRELLLEAEKEINLIIDDICL